ncbi:hypothetical protein SETIT_2G443100v2 [Setaria italica]|uniref:PHD-type domain-containing protein n=1 Tax=Setaria italica TaxID=4555 RepID=A0A368Q9W3_SETIT|nr:hypothetical protein SETIT_2G443100v2 [Setaria italica]
MTTAAAWQPVALDAEFSPEVAALLISERGRRQLSSRLRSRNEALRTKVRKHLVALGWTIVSRRNAAMAPRLRYESHDGKTYCSLPDLIVAAGATRSLLDDQHPPPPPPETNKIYNDDDDDPAPTPTQQEDANAIAEYVALMASNHRAMGPTADRLRASAKRQLQASGWSFWMKLKSDGREELRYKAPTGRSYPSLHTACQAFTSTPSESTTAPTTGNRKKRKISELLRISSGCGSGGGGPVIKKCTTVQKKKTCQAVEGAADGSCLIKRCTTTTTVSSKRKKKKAAGSSRVLRPSCEAAAATCPRRARTLLSVLIDEGILVPRDKVTYSAAAATSSKVGLITGDGVIRCTCCGKAFTVAEFEAHATRGRRTAGRPWARLFLKDGRSLSQCLVELMRRDDDRNNKGMRRVVRLKEACLDPGGDSVCSICNDGGELLLCDHCPSAFHHDCLGLPAASASPDEEEEWFCPCCRCAACGGSDFDPADPDDTTRRPLTDKTIIYCEQCEHEYHVGCVEGGLQLQQGPWLCSPGCERVFRHLQGLAGTSIPTSAEGVSLAILRRRSDDQQGVSSEEAMAMEHGKLRAALDVLHECFVPLVEPRTQSDLSADVVFNRESELRRLQFRGYYVVGLEKGGELVTVATLRVYGNKVAELPLVGTRFAHRRQGMLRLLMTELEKMLARDLGVHRLVLPAVPELLRMWTGSMGFRAMTHSDKLEVADHTILCFQGTTMCQKSLLAAAAASSSGYLCT